jgi:hypothetical protein
VATSQIDRLKRRDRSQRARKGIRDPPLYGGRRAGGEAQEEEKTVGCRAQRYD